MDKRQRMNGEDAPSGQAADLPETSPRKKPFANLNAASALTVTLIAFFGSQILAGILIGGFIFLTGRKDPDEILRALSDSTVGQFLFILLVEVLTLAVLFVFMRTCSISLKEIGLGRLPQLRDAGLAIIFFIGYMVLLTLILYGVKGALPAIDLEQEQQIGFEAASGPLALGLVFISLVVLPPIVEEILIRGFLYSGLRRNFNRIISALIASFIFAVAHLQLGSGAPPLYVAAIDTFVLSLVLIVLREKTGSIWSGIGVHAIKNGLAFLSLFVFNIA